MLQAIEAKYPEGKCNYCMRSNVQVMKIECGLKHSFCAQCIVNLCKITRIKKGLVHRFKYQDAIKCPQCFEIILIEKETIKEAKYLESC